MESFRVKVWKRFKSTVWTNCLEYRRKDCNQLSMRLNVLIIQPVQTRMLKILKVNLKSRMMVDCRASQLKYKNVFLHSEHISLEEISSDSDDAMNAKKSKVKSKGNL